MSVAPHIGIMILLAFSLVTTLIVINVGENIVENTPQSKIFDSQKNTQKLIEEKGQK